MREDLLVCGADVLLQMCCFLAALIPASQPEPAAASHHVCPGSAAFQSGSEEVKLPQAQGEGLCLQDHSWWLSRTLLDTNTGHYRSSIPLKEAPR